MIDKETTKIDNVRTKIDKERTKIDKERTWVFSPVNQIVIKVDIQGNIPEEQLKEAIRNTVDQYEMLHQRVVLDSEGNAFYEKADAYRMVISPMNTRWQQIAKEQEKLPFAIDQGEFIRFFYLMKDKGITLLIIAHHIAGDGISFTYLVQDIMRSIAGEKIEYKKLELFQMEGLPSEASLSAPTTWLLKYMNRKWKKTGRLFDFKDYERMYHKYWNNRETLIDTYALEGEVYNAICKYSWEINVSVNTIITTAFLRAAGEQSDVGMAASIRDKGFTGMGNYATGISVKFDYNEKLGFDKNAVIVQKMIYQKLNDASKKYFLLQFMRRIEPTLVDAVYFQACGDYHNKTAGLFSKMFGYDGNPKGISITNLTRIPIETKYGSYEIKDFIFVPPLVMNAKRIIGVASDGTRMELCLHIDKDSKTDEHRKFFNRGVEYLKNLG